jgi:hypothetical protein
MQSINESQSQHEPTASRSSILGLDLLTFLMADVRDGVGPYLSVFLKGGLHWQSGEIGIAMATSSITAAICQIPAGLLVDSVRAKATFGRDLRGDGRPWLSTGCLRAEARCRRQHAGYFRRCFGYHSSGSGCAEPRDRWQKAIPYSN